MCCRRPRRLLASFGFVTAFLCATQVLAARAIAPKMLPKRTLAYVRVADVADLVERFKQTSIGRMVQDPQLRPLVGQLYEKAKEALATVEQETGLTLDDLLAIPRGEVALALVETDSNEPGFLLVVDVGTDPTAVNKLLARGAEEAKKQGLAVKEESVDDAQVVIYGDDKGVQFIKGDTLVASNNVSAARALLASWSGQEDCLAENPQFATIMNSCRAPRDETPQLTWYVDPLGIARQFSQGSLAAQASLAILPAIGLDGLQGVGGSMTFAVGEFDSIGHIHLLLENPRSGVLDLVQLLDGDTAPQAWIPQDVATYATIHVDLLETFVRTEKLVDSFQGAGFLAARVKEISERLGADIVAEVLPSFAGRITYLSAFPKPATTAGAYSLVALELKDPPAFQKILDKIAAKYPDSLSKEAFGTVSYYAFRVPRDENRPELPDPCLAVLHDGLVFVDRSAFLKRVASPQDATMSLASALEYKLIASKIARQAGAAKPALVTFNRPEEGMKYLYDLATGEQSRQRLAQIGENNRFMRTLDETLKQHPLPPFSVLSQYLAPAGAMLTDDETGYHYTSFSLRRE